MAEPANTPTTKELNSLKRWAYFLCGFTAVQVYGLLMLFRSVGILIVLPLAVLIFVEIACIVVLFKTHSKRSRIKSLSDKNQII